MNKRDQLRELILNAAEASPRGITLAKLVTKTLEGGYQHNTKESYPLVLRREVRKLVMEGKMSSEHDDSGTIYKYVTPAADASASPRDTLQKCQS